MTVCIRFSGITVRFILPTAIALPRELSFFLCEETAAPDAEYEFCLLTEPLRPGSPPVHTEAGTHIYRTEQGWLRIYSPLTAEDGCQVACFLSSDGKNKLCYPASMWDFYASPLRCIHLLGAETVLLRHDALLLHSAVVELNGKAILFAGPSGAGKSTQAALWAQHLGAEILNGDRCVIRRTPAGFYGGGSPWSGTSGIYRRESAPIAGIFLVEQAPENSVRRLGAAGFPALFSQTIVNTWDTQYMERLGDLFAELLGQVPVYRLRCRADAEAVETARRAAFGGSE